MNDIAKQALDALNGAAGGAATGSALGPMGAAAGGAIGLAAALLPGAAHLLVQAEPQVAQVVAAVTGTTDPAAQALAAADPDIEANLRIQLAQIAADQQAAADTARNAALIAQIGDVAGARAQTEALAQAGSKIAWGAPVVSIVIVVGFFVVLDLLMLFPATLDPIRATLLNVLLGTLAGGVVQVLNFWLGSSAGSDRKSEMLARSVPVEMLPKPAEILPVGSSQK